MGGPWWQSPIIKWRPPHLYRKKTKLRTELPEGFACPIPLQWGRFLRRGDGSFQVTWRTDVEVDLERTQNYCMELLSLDLRLMIIEIQYSKVDIREFKSHYLRKSRIARHSSKTRIFFYFAKTSLLVTLFKEK